MNESNNKSNRKRFRLRLQFSLRTLLLLTLLAAITCAWMLRPKDEDRLLGGGALKIRARMTHPAAGQDPANPQPVEPILNGRWQLLDAQGRRWVKGYYEDNLPTGRWTYYHANGRRAFSGEVARKVRFGPWIAHFDNGEQRSQTTETQIETTRFGVGGMAWPSKYAEWAPIRNGPAQQYWDTGQLRAEGTFFDDLRHGDWTFFDRDGHRIAAGPYRRGLRHGIWRRWETADGKPIVEQFVHGRLRPDLDVVLPQLTAQLMSDDAGRQVDAAQRLTMLGAAAVPTLKKAIATGDVRRCLLAVRALRQIGPDARTAVEDVARLAEQSPAQLKFASLVALAEIDPDRAEVAYDQLLRNATGPDQQLRDRAEMALSSAGPAGLKTLEAALVHETPAVRYAALASIARMLQRRLESTPTGVRPAEAPATTEIRAVLEAAQLNPDPKIRAAAVWMKQMQKRTWFPGWTPIPVVG